MKKTKFILILILLIASFLRFWKIDQVPVSLFGDELDVGYHAYSILKTGKDYMGNPWPLHFQSQAEWRTPLYLYSAVPTVFLFKISPLGVRLPAMIFGVLSVWAIYLFVREFLNSESMGKLKEKLNSSTSPANTQIALWAAFFLAISPWHIQYSRAAFEVTELLFCFLMGLYLFFKALKNHKYLWISMLFLSPMPWIYSSAKLFLPMLLICLGLLWFKQILRMPIKSLIKSAVVLLIFGIPMLYSILAQGGAQRFNYLSVFTDPTMEGDVGFARLNDSQMRQKYSGGVIEKVAARFIHNKYTFWSEKVLDNVFKPFSADFFFIKGDLNLRHSIEGMGQFYKVDAIFLIIGIILFFTSGLNNKLKIFLLFWILGGVIPASITRDGGTHATRLILILPPLIFLMAYGIFEFTSKFNKLLKSALFLVFGMLLLINFIFYQHNYWVHNPWYSERWWHSGFREMFDQVKKVEGNYDKIIFSNANEPPLIFFLGWNMYSPELFHKGMEHEYVNGFDTVDHLGKYYFGQVGKEGIYALPQFLDKKSLYVAVQRELGWNLIMEPSRVPPGLKLVKAIPYPSGEPAFYLFERSDN